MEGHLLSTHLDDGIFSSRRSSCPTVVHGLGFCRERGDKPFTDSDRALVELFHTECVRFLLPEAGTVDSVLRSRLAPREHDTLELLLDGCSDKEIAERLGISTFTVNQYNKSLFRRFGVRSRTALLAKLLRSAPAE